MGHITPEAFEGGLIAIVQDDDIIEIDAVSNTINLKVSDKVIDERKKVWIKPEFKVKKGLLYKYALTVSSAAEGCVTDEA